jgi:hypothetical protein
MVDVWRRENVLGAYKVSEGFNSIYDHVDGRQPFSVFDKLVRIRSTSAQEQKQSEYIAYVLRFIRQQSYALALSFRFSTRLAITLRRRCAKYKVHTLDAMLKLIIDFFCAYSYKGCGEHDRSTLCSMLSRVSCKLECGKSEISDSSDRSTDRSTETFRKFFISDCSGSVSLSEEIDEPRQIAVVGTAVIGVRSTLMAVKGVLVGLAPSPISSSGVVIVH